MLCKSTFSSCLTTAKQRQRCRIYCIVITASTKVLCALYVPCSACVRCSCAKPIVYFPARYSGFAAQNIGGTGHRPHASQISPALALSFSFNIRNIRNIDCMSVQWLRGSDDRTNLGYISCCELVPISSQMVARAGLCSCIMQRVCSASTAYERAAVTCSCELVYG